jgi:sugar lactone lactonase YvrE
MMRLACVVGAVSVACSAAGCWPYVDESLWQRTDGGRDARRDSGHDAPVDAPGREAGDVSLPADAQNDLRTEARPPDLRSPDLPRDCTTDPDCEDGLSCTKDSCASGTCSHAVLAGFCLIGASCVASGAANPQNACLACIPATSPSKWTENNGASCNDGVACTHTDRCSQGVCQGTAYTCSDGLACTTDSCTGLPPPGGCAFALIAGNCLIQGTCHSSGALNPAAKCQQCSPSSSTSAWSPISQCVSTIAGNGTAAFADGPVATARLNQPYGVKVDSAGKVYVADQTNHRIRTIFNGQVATLAGSGTLGFADGPAATAMFNAPRAVALYGASVYVTDSDNNRIRLIAGGQVTTVAGSGTAGYVDGAAATAQFNQPRGLAVNSAGTIYVAEYSNHTIRAIAGGQVTTLAGNGTAGSADGPVASARFSYPRDVAVDGAGTIYVADSGNHKIRVISGGQVSTLAGFGVAGFVDGAAASARFNAPYAVALGAGGKVYVADKSNHRIRLISGGQVTTLAGGTPAGFVDGPAATARFNEPSGLAADGSGQVYVADHLNSAIRLYTP